MLLKAESIAWEELLQEDASEIRNIFNSLKAWVEPNLEAHFGTESAAAAWVQVESQTPTDDTQNQAPASGLAAAVAAAVAAHAARAPPTVPTAPSTETTLPRPPTDVGAVASGSTSRATHRTAGIIPRTRVIKSK